MRDFSLDENSIFVDDDLDLILQQIDILFDTHIGEVLGEFYGSDFEKYLWDLNISAADISEYVEDIITTYINLFDYTLSVDTQCFQGTQNDIILITISLKNESQSIEKTYKLG
jgi:hypothetical protein